MNKFRIVTLMLLLLFVIPTTAAVAENDEHSKHEGKMGIQLSASLRKALSDEMTAVQGGMQNLIPAIASGNWDVIAEISNSIKKSYIIKQKLTKDQLKELRQALPHGFKKLDHRFHKTAGLLSHAAKDKDGELVSFYFYKLHEGCVNCHSTYAQKRFPSFIKHKKNHDHH